MRIGAHVRTGKGWPAAAEYAAETGCECVQVFTKSPQTWGHKPLDPDAVDGFRRRLEDEDIGPVYVHAAYLLNLCAEEGTLRRRTVSSLATELTRAAEVGAIGVVTHLGSDKLGDLDAARQRARDAIVEAYGRVEEPAASVAILLENTAGAGNQYGGSLVHVGKLARSVREADDGIPVGVCLDTCHAYAYGYDLAGEAGWTEALDDLEGAAWSGAVTLLHANDTTHELGSKRDRHAWIGEGLIGESGFAAMLCEERLSGADVVVEMPGDPPEKDRVNVERLVSLRSACR